MMSTTTRARFRAAVVAIAPAVLLFALVVMSTARFVPLGAALYVGGAAAIVALWLLAYEMWRHPEAARQATQPQPVPAT